LRANGNRTLLRLIADSPVLLVLARVGQWVDRTRSRQRRDRHPVMSRRTRHCGVSRTARGEPAGRVLLVGRDRLSPANQVNERSKMNTGDFDDVIAFLPQRQRNSPAAVRCDVQDHYPESEILDFRHYFGNVLICASNKCIANRTALS
jgi:hypothetical protein